MKNKYLIDINNFTIIKKLGHGVNGTVFSVQDKKTNQKFAAKKIQIDEHNNASKNREINVMIHIQHPTIIKFYGYSLASDSLTLYMELAEKGSLQKLLNEARHGTLDVFFDNTMRQKMLIGISRGMMYLHKNHAIHRDLKPENILLDSDLEPKIADFGSSKFLSSENAKSQTSNVGTCIYMAPEVITSTHYNEKADVYSFGIIMYEILTESFPYENIDEFSLFQLQSKIVNEKLRPEFKIPVKDSFRQLIIQCWSDNPESRPSFEEIYYKLTSNNRDSEDQEPTYFLSDVDENEILLYIEKININSSENDEIDQINKNHQEEIDFLANYHQNEMDQMNKKHKDEINDLQITHQNEIDQIHKKHKDEINDLQVDHQNEIDQICEKHKDEINDLQVDHQNEIDQICKRHKDEINNLQNEIIHIKREHQKQINHLKNAYQDEIDLLLNSHEDEVNALKNEIKSLKLRVENISSKTNEMSSYYNVPYKKGFELQGIINYFTQNSNINNELQITSSSIYKNDPSFSPLNVIKYHDKKAEFHTNDLPNSWICFEFINHRIIPKNYTIRSFELDRNASHMRSWVVEGMNKQNKWDVLDVQSNCSYLNGRNMMYTFTINNKSNQNYQIIRIRQTEPNWRGKNFFKVNSIEFYGFII